MKLPAACAMLLAGCAALPMNDAARSLAEAESAFAAHSVREDMRAAFLASFAEDGLFVRSGWTPARAFLSPLPAPPIVLDWRPAYVEVAASGEIGLSTGPWRLAPRDRPGAPPAFGQFVSVWTRAPGGPWKVAADLGISHEGPALWDAPLEARQAPAAPAQPGASLQDAERRFAAEASATGARSAYAAHASRELRFYRNGAAPLLGRDAALASTHVTDERLSWRPERSAVAASGDLGYVLGSYARAAAPTGALGWYLRVWRREAAGWRIALDVTNPAPR